MSAPRFTESELEQIFEQAERVGRLPKVVVPVHLAGQSCDMEAIAALARRYGFRLVEDASHAVGAHYKEETVGNCRHSDICVFSFHPVKIITTGEGGMALTNSGSLAEKMRLLRSHGVTREPEQMEREPEGGWYYEQVTLGFNYRLTDMQAALGTSQMQRLDAFVQRRRALAARYDAALSGEPLVLPWQDPTTRSSYHLYIVRTGPKSNHGNVYDRLRDKGVGVNLHYMPVYLQPFYRRLGFAPGHCPEAEAYYKQAISLPLYADLDDEDQDWVVRAVSEVLAS